MTSPLKLSLALLPAFLPVNHNPEAQQYLQPEYNQCIRLVDGGFGTITIKNDDRPGRAAARHLPSS